MKYSDDEATRIKLEIDDLQDAYDKAINEFQMDQRTHVAVPSLNAVILSVANRLTDEIMQGLAQTLLSGQPLSDLDTLNVVRLAIGEATAIGFYTGYNRGVQNKPPVKFYNKCDCGRDSHDISVN